MATQEKNFNRALVNCPVCAELYTVHAIKNHWQKSHHIEYHRRFEFFQRWYVTARETTLEDA